MYVLQKQMPSSECPCKGHCDHLTMTNTRVIFTDTRHAIKYHPIEI